MEAGAQEEMMELEPENGHTSGNGALLSKNEYGHRMIQSGREQKVDSFT